jgi:hypothetical protein
MRATQLAETFSLEVISPEDVTKRYTPEKLQQKDPDFGTIDKNNQHAEPKNALMNVVVPSSK